MLKSKKLLFSIVTLIIATLACNLPGGQPPSSNATPDLVLTITAQALLLQPSSNNQPPELTLTPAIPPQVMFTDIPTSTATITPTPTSSIPMLTVSADTNCRSGPSKDYEHLGALLANESAEIVGRNTATNYWIIKNPDEAGFCWLWGEYATVSGNVSGLKEYAIPATPTPTAPEPVTKLKENKICFFDGFRYKLSGFITWQASGGTEQYWIYLNGNLHGMTFADQATTYAIPALNLAPGGSISMGVQAVSDFGKSPLREVTITCP